MRVRRRIGEAMRYTPEQIEAALLKCDADVFSSRLKIALFGEEDYSIREIVYALEECTCDGMWIDEILEALSDSE